MGAACGLEGGCGCVGEIGNWMDGLVGNGMGWLLCRLTVGFVWCGGGGGGRLFCPVLMIMIKLQ